MPAKGDHQARRADVAEAVWRVLAAHGFGGLTLRAVATELGASTGLLTHYFRNKQELVRYAHEIAAERSESRARLTTSIPGLAQLRVALMNVLPLTPEVAAMSRVWVSFWDAALDDPSLHEAQRQRYAGWRSRLEKTIRDAGDVFAGRDPAEVAVTCAAFTHGLVVQALFDPVLLPAPRQLALLDGFLADLTGQR